MGISIVVADKHPIVRQGLRLVLEREHDFSIVGEAGDSQEAADMVDRVKPNVLVLDVMMSGLSGVEVLSSVHDRSPQTKVVVVSMHGEKGFVVEAIRKGAKAFILLRCTPSNLVKAIREAAADRPFLGPLLSGRGIEEQLADPQSSGIALTPRERQVLPLAAEGHTNAEIAAKLLLSPRTVEMHRSNLMRKLGLKSSTDLVRYAIWSGVLPLEDFN